MSETNPIAKALQSPVKTVQKGDRKVEYRSADELMKIEQHLNRKKRGHQPLYTNVNYQVSRGL